MNSNKICKFCYNTFIYCLCDIDIFGDYKQWTWKQVKYTDKDSILDDSQALK